MHRLIAERSCKLNLYALRNLEGGNALVLLTRSGDEALRQQLGELYHVRPDPACCPVPAARVSTWCALTVRVGAGRGKRTSMST
jgi:hypothetical protein